MPRKKQEGGNETPREPAKIGRKSKYQTHILPYLDAIAAMMRNGATLDILSERFNVSVSTLCEYQNKFSEFREALKENAEIADFAVENALYKNATSGNLPAQIFWLKNRQSKRWRDKQHVFQASSTVVRKDYENMSAEELDKEWERLSNIVPGEDEEAEFEEGELH